MALHANEPLPAPSLGPLSKSAWNDSSLRVGEVHIPAQVGDWSVDISLRSMVIPFPIATEISVVANR